MNNIMKIINKLTNNERSKTCTELLGNQQGAGATGWLTEVINALRNIKGKTSIEAIHHGHEHQTIKSNVVLLLVSLMEGDA